MVGHKATYAAYFVCNLLIPSNSMEKFNNRNILQIYFYGNTRFKIFCKAVLKLQARIMLVNHCRKQEKYKSGQKFAGTHNALYRYKSEHLQNNKKLTYKIKNKICLTVYYEILGCVCYVVALREITISTY